MLLHVRRVDWKQEVDEKGTKRDTTWGILTTREVSPLSQWEHAKKAFWMLGWKSSSYMGNALVLLIHHLAVFFPWSLPKTMRIRPFRRSFWLPDACYYSVFAPRRPLVLVRTKCCYMRRLATGYVCRVKPSSPLLDFKSHVLKSASSPRKNDYPGIVWFYSVTLCSHRTDHTTLHKCRSKKKKRLTFLSNNPILIYLTQKAKTPSYSITHFSCRNTSPNPLNTSYTTYLSFRKSSFMHYN